MSVLIFFCIHIIRAEIIKPMKKAAPWMLYLINKTAANKMLIMENNKAKFFLFCQIMQRTIDEASPKKEIELPAPMGCQYIAINSVNKPVKKYIITKLILVRSCSAIVPIIRRKTMLETPP